MKSPGTAGEHPDLPSESGSGRPEELTGNRSAPTVEWSTASPKHPWRLALLLVAVTLVAYLPAIRGEFLWDDDSWTSNVAGLLRDFSGLLRLWSTPAALQQYYPLTGTSFWLDYQLWGFRALPYHIENVLLHAFAALLFWRLLRRLQVSGAGLAGAIFALHPLMVESAGWITERKNVLSLVLYLGALLAYGRFTGFWGNDQNHAAAPVAADSRQHRRAFYTLSFLLFLAALLAKTTAFSLPAVILLLCWWKRGRIRLRADALPIVPFFALALGLSLLTAWLEKNHVGAKGPEWAFSFPDRCLIAGRAVWFYVGKLIWPADLCFVYPRWRLDATSLSQWICPAAAIGTLLALWLARARIGRGPVAAVFFYVGTLLPVLGFMNAYFMRFSFVCDHWVYVSSLGLIALATALVVRTVERLRVSIGLRGLALLVLPVLVILTWRQSRMYTDNDTLWRTTLNRNPNAFIAHNNLGLALYHSGKLDDAIAHFRRSVEIYPGGAESRNNLGEALLQKGQLDEALTQFQEAASLQPGNVVARNNLGVALRRKGRVDEAIAQFQKVLQVEPENVMTHTELGVALLHQGRTDEAVVQFRHAVRIDPKLAAVHAELARRYLQERQAREAVAHFEAALEVQPARADILNDLAWVLATCPDPSIRDGAKAVELAQQAERFSGGNDPSILATLAAACAEAGRFPEAVDTARRALALTAAGTNTAQVAVFQTRIGLYQSGLPFRDSSLAPAALSK